MILPFSSVTMTRPSLSTHKPPGSGGEAKHLVDEGEVKLNGEIESRKRAKVRIGDKVEVFNEIIELE